MEHPSSTYRLQLHAGFSFHDAAAITPYLSALGVTHAYCSPYLQAAEGSTHGYDVVDHSRANGELGGDEGLQRFVSALQAHDLRQVLDIVPNHMAISSAQNRWWTDVLENGPSSLYASYFDVDWDPPEARLRNTILIPVLGDHYGRVLEKGELTVVRDVAHFRLAYAEHRYPLNPNSLGQILGPAGRRRESEPLMFLADAFGGLPRATATDRASHRRRRRDISVLRSQFARLLEDDANVRLAVDETLAALNQDHDALHTLLEQQNYRLAWWRSAGRDLGYRRFFDINTLIGLRVEDEQVFNDTHQRILQWVDQGRLDGLRIDHPDGLRDPQGYLDRLRAAAPSTWIVVEKILEPGEPLPNTWPVAGTTGYDFLNDVAGLFVDPEGEAPLTRSYADFTGEPTDYAQLLHQKKLFVLREVLGSDINRLTDLLLQICEQHLRQRDYSRHDLTEGLRELIASFAVYRTYVAPARAQITDTDRQEVEHAIARAVAARPDLDTSLFDFLRDLLLATIAGDLEAEFVARFQQLTGPAMAKGVEDTLFYTYNRFIALNEVGGDPSRFGVGLDTFHHLIRLAQQHWPQRMLATATHDTKRGEDVRARLAVLSQEPEEWVAAVARWSALTDAYRTGDWPDRNTEYFFYQAAVGAWPVSAGRLTAYMEKATREAKVHTSWTSPHEAYDRAVKTFVEGALGDRRFTEDVTRFVAAIRTRGYINALAQTLLKLTVPGVPDLYQGTELWAFYFVDPDNRQPVDYETRQRLLAEMAGLDARSIWARAEEGLPKLWVVAQTLALRRRRPDVFDAGGYNPLWATGAAASHVVAFMRGGETLTIVPRLLPESSRISDETVLELPAGEWRNVLTEPTPLSGRVSLAEVWRDFPVALLERV